MNLKEVTKAFLTRHFPVESHSLALTLTFNTISTGGEIAQIRAANALKKFRNAFYRRLLGSRWELRRCPAEIWTYEQSDLIHLHAHGAITLLHSKEEADIRASIEHAISRTHDLAPIYDLQIGCDLGWVNYITKLHNADDCVDWLATRL